MAGGLGDDTYQIDDAGDRTVEFAGEGTDLVRSSIDYAMRPNLENLTLLGTADLNGIGNGLDNVITGNSGNNVLSGGDGNDTIDGGSGNDTLNGGDGNDSLFGNSGNDSFVVSAGNNSYDGGDGIDKINFSATAGATVFMGITGSNAGAAAGDYVNVENYVGSNTGTDWVVGNSLDANVFWGNGGDDTLLGKAGIDNLRAARATTAWPAAPARMC